MKKSILITCATAALASTFISGSVGTVAQAATTSTYFVSSVKTDKQETKNSVTFKEGKVTISATKKATTTTPGTSTLISSVRVSKGSSSFDIKLSDGIFSIQSMAVSSDQSHVAIHLEKEAGSELLVVNLNKQTHAVLNTIVKNAAAVETVFAYQWSPTGSTLALAYGNTSLSRVALYDAATAVFTYVPRETSTISSAAVLWNKKGTTIDFASEYPSDKYKLYRYTLSTKKVKVVKSLTRSEVNQLAKMQ